MTPLLNWLKRNSNTSLKQQLVHTTTILLFQEIDLRNAQCQFMTPNFYFSSKPKITTVVSFERQSKIQLRVVEQRFEVFFTYTFKKKPMKVGEVHFF